MFYIIYDENGQFYGFQDSKEYAQQIVNDNISLSFHEISDGMHYFLINSQQKFTVNIELISDIECLDEEKYFYLRFQNLLTLRRLKKILSLQLKINVKSLLLVG